MAQADTNGVIEILPAEAVNGTMKLVFVGRRAVSLRIPPGIADGSVLRLAGQGARQPLGGPAADVYLRVKVRSRPYRPPRRDWATWSLTGSAIALALVIVVVVALITAHRGVGSRVASGDMTSGAAPATTVAPITPAAYQQALTELDNALMPGFRQLAGAGSPQAIDAATTAIQDALTAQLPTWQNLAPPPAVAAANTALVNGLQGLQSDLNPVTSAADTSAVCLGSAATALLSRGADLGPLRDAIGQLAANSFQVGAFLPPVTQDVDRVLVTGAVVDGGTGQGEGWLDIANGGTDDATVGLVPVGGNTPLVTAYIGHGGSFTLKGIPDGTYQVYMTSGRDWDAGARLFARDCQFQKFDDPFTFTTTSSEATTYRITLTPVTDGAAGARNVDPNTYPR
jgi:DnaJ-like protein